MTARLPDEPEKEDTGFLRRRVAGHLELLNRDQMIALVRWLDEQERGT